MATAQSPLPDGERRAGVMIRPKARESANAHPSNPFRIPAMKITVSSQNGTRLLLVFRHPKR